MNFAFLHSITLVHFYYQILQNAIEVVKILKRMRFFEQEALGVRHLLSSTTSWMLIDDDGRHNCRWVGKDLR